VSERPTTSQVLSVDCPECGRGPGEACRGRARLTPHAVRETAAGGPKSGLASVMLGVSAGGFPYGDAMAAFWRIHLGAHSLLRCPGSKLCPGGCGANARDDMAAIHDARRGRADEFQQERVRHLLKAGRA